MRILHLITRMDRGGSAVNTLVSAIQQLKQGNDVVLAMGLSEESEMSADESYRVTGPDPGFGPQSRPPNGSVLHYASMLPCTRSMADAWVPE